MMKRIVAALLSFLLITSLSGCFRKMPPPHESESSQEISAPDPELMDPKEPEGAATILLEGVREWDDAAVEELASEYLNSQQLPAAYYDILKPIASQVSYTLGNSKTDGDTAMVDVSVTAVDAKSALNKAVAGAAIYIAAKKAGGSTSTAEELFTDYASANIDWNSLPTIKTDTTLHLVKAADDEWKVDADNPENLKFLNALSGGAIDVAQDLQNLVSRFQ